VPTVGKGRSQARRRGSSTPSLRRGRGGSPSPGSPHDLPDHSPAESRSWRGRDGEGDDANGSAVPWMGSWRFSRDNRHRLGHAPLRAPALTRIGRPPHRLTSLYRGSSVEAVIKIRAAIQTGDPPSPIARMGERNRCRLAATIFPRHASPAPAAARNSPGVRAPGAPLPRRCRPQSHRRSAGGSRRSRRGPAPPPAW
jgi:hypothetical protein